MPAAEQYWASPETFRQATAEWRANATPEQQARQRGHKRAYKERLRVWMEEIKRAVGCVDCGTQEGRLDFDHRPGTVKLFNPSRLDRTNREALQAEIDKCDVRCASCHTRRHQLEKPPATHCKRGHPLEGDNVIARPDGGRRCRECTNARRRKP